MHIEHIVPLALGGTSDDTNLWLACAWCNSFKGTKVSGADPVTGAEVPLFNPGRNSGLTISVGATMAAKSLA
jgi:5-methylcytosine-specific restriction endonuclease McrA